MIKDSTNKMPITICELLIEQVSEESCYNMTNMQAQRYLGEPEQLITENNFNLRSIF